MCSELATSVAASRRRSVVITTVVRAILIVSVSALAGLSVNYARLVSGELTGVVQHVMGAHEPHEFISLEQAANLYRKGDVLFVDARSKARFEAAHIPGAINIPLDRRDESFAPRSEWFPVDIPVIVYGRAKHVPEIYGIETAMTSAGCAQVYLLREGLEGWQSQQLPIVTGPEPRWEGP